MNYPLWKCFVGDRSFQVFPSPACGRIITPHKMSDAGLQYCKKSEKVSLSAFRPTYSKRGKAQENVSSFFTVVAFGVGFVENGLR